MGQPDNVLSGMDYTRMDQNITLFTDAINDMEKQAFRVEDEKTQINNGFFGEAGTAYQGALRKWQEGYDFLKDELEFMKTSVEGGKQLTVKTEGNSNAIVQGLTSSF